MHGLNSEGKFPIVAMDKSNETHDWISKGIVSATMIRKPYMMASYGARFIGDFHHDGFHEFQSWQTAPVSSLPAHVDNRNSGGNFKEPGRASGSRGHPPAAITRTQGSTLNTVHVIVACSQSASEAENVNYCMRHSAG